MINSIMLSGIVYKKPLIKISPSGISHCQFILEHSSIQIEAGFSRYVCCLLPVIVSNSKYSKDITYGTQLTVNGFVNSYKGRYGLKKIFLYAKEINFL